MIKLVVLPISICFKSRNVFRMYQSSQREPSIRTLLPTHCLLFFSRYCALRYEIHRWLYSLFAHFYLKKIKLNNVCHAVAVYKIEKIDMLCFGVQPKRIKYHNSTKGVQSIKEIRVWILVSVIFIYSITVITII